MQKIRDDNFYTVVGWMLNVLGLKGNELIIFAIIYSFSQDGKSEFEGSISYMQAFTNIKSEQTVYTVLNSLKDKAYITKREYYVGKVRRCAWRANLELIDSLKSGITEIKPNNQ